MRESKMNELILLKTEDGKTDIAYVHSSLKDLYDRILGEVSSPQRFNNVMLSLLNTACSFKIVDGATAQKARDYFSKHGYLSINNYISWYLLQNSTRYFNCCGNCKYHFRSKEVPDIDQWCTMWHYLTSEDDPPCAQWEKKEIKEK